MPYCVGSWVSSSVWAPSEAAVLECLLRLIDGEPEQRRHGRSVRAAADQQRDGAALGDLGAAGGSVPTTQPFSSTVEVTGCSVASRFAACSAARAASGCCPATFGTSTCRVVGDPPKIR